MMRYDETMLATRPYLAIVRQVFRDDSRPSSRPSSAPGRSAPPPPSCCLRRRLRGGGSSASVQVKKRASCVCARARVGCGGVWGMGQWADYACAARAGGGDAGARDADAERVRGGDDADARPRHADAVLAAGEPVAPHSGTPPPPPQAHFSLALSLSLSLSLPPSLPLSRSLYLAPSPRPLWQYLSLSLSLSLSHVPSLFWYPLPPPSHCLPTCSRLIADPAHACLERLTPVSSTPVALTVAAHA